MITSFCFLSNRSRRHEIIWKHLIFYPNNPFTLMKDSNVAIAANKRLNMRKAAGITVNSAYFQNMWTATPRATGKVGAMV